MAEVGGPDARELGRYTKQKALAEVTRLGLRTRRGSRVSPQTFDALLENPLYIGIIDVPEYGVQGKRGDSRRLSTRSSFIACKES